MANESTTPVRVLKRELALVERQEEKLLKDFEEHGSELRDRKSQLRTILGGEPQVEVTRDYRDDLRDLLTKAFEERGLTRYRLCKQVGIDSGTLSNVLAKRRHFSIELLEVVLDIIDYEFKIVPKQKAEQVPQHPL